MPANATLELSISASGALQYGLGLAGGGSITLKDLPQGFLTTRLLPIPIALTVVVQLLAPAALQYTVTVRLY